MLILLKTREGKIILHILFFNFYNFMIYFSSFDLLIKCIYYFLEFLMNFLLFFSSCLLLRYASQNSLDESSQKHIPRESGKDKPPYRNHHHTNRAFDVINEMRK